MTKTQICKLIREAFPDETIQIGQKFKKEQVEILNLIILELKQNDLGVSMLRQSATP